MNIAETRIYGDNMILKTHDVNNRIEYKKYISNNFEEKFFIVPFKCPICGNSHIFEKGIYCHDYVKIDNKLYKMGDKICDICAAPIRANIRQKWDYFDRTGNRLLLNIEYPWKK